MSAHFARCSFVPLPNLRAVASPTDSVSEEGMNMVSTFLSQWLQLTLLFHSMMVFVFKMGTCLSEFYLVAHMH